MVLLLFFLIGLFIGMLRGGGLSGLAGAKLRWLWLVIFSGAAELVLVFLPRWFPQAFPAALPVLQLLRFIPLLLFAAINIRTWQIGLAGLGVAMNLAVIAANGWRMPVSWEALSVPGLIDTVQRVSAGSVPEFFFMAGPGEAALWFLSDILPFRLVSTGYASAGDVVLGLGVMLFTQHAMARHSYGKHARGSRARRSFAGESGGEDRRGAGRGRGRGNKPQKESGPAEAPQPSGDIADRMPAEVSSRRETQEGSHGPPARHVPVEPLAEAPAPPATQPATQTVTPPPAQPEAAPGPYGARREPPAPKPAQTRPPSPEEPEKMLFRPGGGPAAPATPFNPPYRSAAPSDKPDVELLSEWHTEGAAAAPAGRENPVRLPPRLAAIAAMVDPYAIVADVGCDHGKLAAWLACNGAPRVIAIDVSAKSLSKAKQLVKELDLQNVVQTRVGDGLGKLRAGEADIVVVAGLGGPTICSILERGRAVAGSAARLVLQPMNAVGTVRRWLVDNGYSIVGEELAEDEGRIYQILSAVPGSDGTPPLLVFDLEVGHLLVKNRHPLLGRLLEDKIALIDGILGEIAGNDTARAEARRSELTELRRRCEEVMRWAAQ